MLSSARGIGRCSSSTNTPPIRAGFPKPVITSPSPSSALGTNLAASTVVAGAGARGGAGGGSARRAVGAAGGDALGAALVAVPVDGPLGESVDEPPPPPPPPPPVLGGGAVLSTVTSTG